MNRSKWITVILAPAALISVSTWAHEPSEHMKTGEKADCSAMHDMDHSKMDMNDPVMQAMMQKCMHQNHGEAKGGEKQNAEHSGNGRPPSNAKADEHSHNH
jgi:hypothetical protein